MGIDKGNWEIGKRLLPSIDPLEHRQFGGGEQELYAIHSYGRALKDLKTKGQQSQGKKKEDEEEGGG